MTTPSEFVPSCEKQGKLIIFTIQVPDGPGRKPIVKEDYACLGTDGCACFIEMDTPPKRHSRFFTADAPTKAQDAYKARHKPKSSR